MCSTLRTAALVAALTVGGTVHAATLVSESDTVATIDGWLVDAAAGNGVDFWTFSAGPGELNLSVSITSDLDFGISVYAGIVGDDFGTEIIGFDNDGDFGDGVFIAGTPTFPTAGSELLGVLLPGPGDYTIAVGGDGASGFAIGPFDYSITATAVPVPAAVWLFGSALAGLATLTKRRIAAIS